MIVLKGIKKRGQVLLHALDWTRGGVNAWSLLANHPFAMDYE